MAYFIFVGLARQAWDRYTSEHSVFVEYGAEDHEQIYYWRQKERSPLAAERVLTFDEAVNTRDALRALVDSLFDSAFDRYGDSKVSIETDRK